MRARLEGALGRREAVLVLSLGWTGVAACGGTSASATRDASTANQSDGAPGEAMDGPEDSRGDGAAGEPLDAGEGCGDACVAGYSDVLTHRYDNLRTGANLNETLLTPANVASLHQFYVATVDGQIYAQPLYVHGVAVEGGTRSLLFVETMEDSVYAFDADDGSPVWHDTLGTPAFSARNVGGDNGILSTPVIDRAANTMYVVVRDCDPSQPATSPSCVQRLVALDVRNGSTLRSVAIAGQSLGAAGAVVFDPNAQWSRTALLLEGGQVYVAFAAGPNGNQHEEDFTYHGWVFAYEGGDFTTAPLVYCSTPNGKGGGIWQSGHGLASDGSSVYFVTGNSVIGSMTQSPRTFAASPVDNEDSLVKWTQPAAATATTSAGGGDAGTGEFASYYDNRPYHSDGDVFQYMESNDVELSASGPLLLPGTNQVVTSGKSGILYNVDRDTMQPAQPPLSVFTNPPLSAGQSLYVYSYAGDPTVNGAPTFWQPNVAPGAAIFGLIYAWPQNDYLKALRYDFATHLIETTPALTASNPITTQGGMLSLSANGGTPGTGVLWASSALNGTGHVWAFDAETLASIWDIAIPNYAKFVPPVVVDGKVFVTSSAAGATASVIAFGL